MLHRSRPCRLALVALWLGLQGLWAGAGPYRIATTPWMGWAFLDVAEAKGFWKEQGLAVELRNYPDGTSYLDAQLARVVDLSCAMVGDVVWIHTHRAPVRILLETDWSSGGDVFFVRKGLAPAQLEGRPIGYYQDRYALPFFLKQTLGAEFGPFQACPAAVFTPQDLVAQFRAGRLDLGVLCDPYVAELGPEAVIRCTSGTRPGSLPECLFGFRDVVERIPARDLRGLVRGIVKAQAWMQAPEHARELFDIVQARSFRDSPLRDLADLASQVRHAPTHPPGRLRRRNAPGGGLEQFLAGLQRFLTRHDPAGAGYRPGDLFDPEWTGRLLVAP